MGWTEGPGKLAAIQVLSFTVTLNKSFILLSKRIHHKKILLANSHCRIQKSNKQNLCSKSHNFPTKTAGRVELEDGE